MSDDGAREFDDPSLWFRWSFRHGAGGPIEKEARERCRNNHGRDRGGRDQRTGGRPPLFASRWLGSFVFLCAAFRFVPLEVKQKQQDKKRESPQTSTSCRADRQVTPRIGTWPKAQPLLIAFDGPHCSKTDSVIDRAAKQGHSNQ